MTAARKIERIARPSFTAAQRLKCFEDHGAVVCCQEADCDNAIYIKGCDIDHHLALVDGGKHEQANFRPICSSCHRKKSAREHKGNARAKRLKHAQETHKAVVDRVMTRAPGKVKPRQFDRTYRRKMNGQVEKRT